MLGHANPSVTATARGGIEFVWEAEQGEEIDVTLPAAPGEPIEITWTRRRPDGAIVEDERSARMIDDAVALILSVSLPA